MQLRTGNANTSNDVLRITWPRWVANVTAIVAVIASSGSLLPLAGLESNTWGGIIAKDNENIVILLATPKNTS